MNIYQKYKEFAVKILTSNGWGSGCLFQPDSPTLTYVFTAKHCLTDEQGVIIPKEQITITRETGETLTIQELYIHPSLDLALITVQLVLGLPTIWVGEPVANLEYGIYGFPNALNNLKQLTGYKVPAIINFIDNNHFVLRSSVSLATYHTGEAQIVKGLSGSGTYFEHNQDLVLTGIFIGFTASGAAFDSLKVMSIDNFNVIVTANQLPPIIPHTLLDFSLYIKDAFNHHDHNIELVLSKYAAQLQQITPYDIVTKLGNKLFLPEDNMHITNPQLWTGWLALLTYLFIESGGFSIVQNWKRTKSNGNEHRIRFYYSEKFKRLPDAIRHLIVDLNNDIQENDCVIVNHPGNVGTPYFDANKIGKIVRDIGASTLYENGIDIAQSDITKNMYCFHIEYFTQRFVEYNEIEEFKKLEESLRCCITEVFDSVGE